MIQKSFWSRYLLAYCITNIMYATTEFRTPLDFIRLATSHYQLEVVKYNAYDSYDGYSDCHACSDTKSFNWNVASGLYGRTAWKAFIDPDCTPPIVDPCNPCSSKDRHKQSLAALWFGKEAFKAEEAFFGGMITSPEDLQGNPAVAFSTITPQFKYTEKGAWVGVQGEYRFGRARKWNMGFRASLPFKVIEVEPTLLDGSVLEGGLASVLAESVLELNAGPNGNAIDYAYRLDFLSTLIRASLVTPLPLVEYGTAASPNNTKIAGIVVGATSRNETATNTPPIYVIKSNNGAIPARATLPGSVPPVLAFAKQYSQVQTTALPVSGAGTDGQVYFFDPSSNYAAALGMDRATQSTLFVVPRMINNSGDDPSATPNDLATRAVSIRSAITELLDQLELQGNDSAVAFLRNNCCIDLAKFERSLGIGDLRSELYFGYGPESKRWYADGVIGAVFPTAKGHKDPRRVYYQPTGNHKHFELLLGLEAGARWCKYFGLKTDIFYGHAFKKDEHRAAPFQGATIKNIGVPLEMGVSWDTVTGHADLTFFSPCHADLGFSVGYEGYFKSRDHIDICPTTAVDCLGNTQPLNVCILERNSSTVSHKIRAEVFHRSHCFEFMMGASQVVAGRNVMQETEAHIGTVIYF